MEFNIYFPLICCSSTKQMNSFQNYISKYNIYYQKRWFVGPHHQHTVKLPKCATRRGSSSGFASDDGKRRQLLSFTRRSAQSVHALYVVRMVYVSMAHHTSLVSYKHTFTHTHTQTAKPSPLFDEWPKLCLIVGINFGFDISAQVAFIIMIYPLSLLQISQREYN